MSPGARTASKPRSQRMVPALLALFAAAILLVLPAESTSPAARDKLDLALTPSWPIHLGVGEQAVLQCGVYTAGKPELYTIKWTGLQGSDLSNVTDKRVNVSRNDGLVKKRAGAYSVLTLQLSDLKQDDSGVYICTASGGNATAFRSISIKVHSSDVACGFEDSLCGWNVEQCKVCWKHYRSGQKELLDRRRGPRSDHTYGPSSSRGHFMEVELLPFGQSHVKPVTVRLSSALLPPTDKARCLTFWYYFLGRDSDMLKVIVNGDETVAARGNVSSDTWRQAHINISPQKDKYQVILEASIHYCNREVSCKSPASAVDDMMWTEGSCHTTNVTQPHSSLSIRLVNGSRPSEGRVEVLHDARWGTICSTRFGMKEAKVICEALGYSSANAMSKRGKHPFGGAPDNFMIWLQKLDCKTHTTNLESCLARRETWGQVDTRCTHKMDAAVICQDKDHPTTPEMPTVAESTTGGAETTPAMTTQEFSTMHTTEVQSSHNMANTSTAVTSGVTGNGTAYNYTTASEPPDQTPALTGSNTAVAAGIIIPLLILCIAAGFYIYRKQKNRRKSKYITFTNPKYHRDHLPTNEISLDSPLTSGHSIIA